MTPKQIAERQLTNLLSLGSRSIGHPINYAFIWPTVYEKQFAGRLAKRGLKKCDPWRELVDALAEAKLGLPLDSDLEARELEPKLRRMLQRRKLAAKELLAWYDADEDGALDAASFFRVAAGMMKRKGVLLFALGGGTLPLVVALAAPQSSKATHWAKRAGGKLRPLAK